jgi:asparagine synthase (glutamine-hydrolysing)
MSSICGIINSINSMESTLLLKIMAQGKSSQDSDNLSIYTSDDKRLLLLSSSRKQKSQLFVNYDKSIAIIFSGSIYNFDTLRKEIINSNYLSNNTGEVLTQLYYQYGIEFVEKLNGMFSIALYDKKKNKVFLMRDRLGTKPH